MFGVVVLIIVLDYEVMLFYSLIVCVFDSNGGIVIIFLILIVLDVNDFFQFFGVFYLVIISENFFSGSDVIKIIVIDVDGDYLIYSLLGMNSGYFQILLFFGLIEII